MRGFSLIRVPLIALAFAGISLAEVLRVPTEFMTIQAALDALSAGDTVAVSAGTYEEALTAPPLPFVLLGEAITDTGVHPLTVIDPTDLPGSDSLACLILPANSRAIVENITFRSGPEMYPRSSPYQGSGVILFSDNAVVRRCVFDSTCMGFSSAYNEIEGTAIIENCHFFHNSEGCAFVPRFRLLATNSYFSGRGWKLISCNQGSRIAACQIRDNDVGYLLTAVGGDIVVEDCVFGPRGAHVFRAVVVSGIGLYVRNNLFADCLLGASVLSVRTPCEGDSVFVSGNVFRNNRGGGNSGMAIGCDTTIYPPNAFATVENNLFQDSESANTGTKGIAISVQAHATGNRFIRLEPSDPPTIKWGREVELTLRDNIFLQTHYALARADQFVSTTADARWNYWGDSTGPYHPYLNPDGLGDAVGDFVLFDPWYADTSFLHAPRPRPTLPERFSLTAYPNPFNSAVRLRFEAAEIGIYEIALFDLLGRQVSTVWKGPVGDIMEVSYRADALPSGVYFARARNAIFNRTVATTKVVLVR